MNGYKPSRSRSLIRGAVAFAVAGGLSGAVMAAAPAAASAADNYGPGAVYQVEISANEPYGSFWVWAGLYVDSNGNQTVDYEETDCIHLPHIATAAANDTGEGGTWAISGGTLSLYNIEIIGNAATANFAVPLPQGSNYGHSSGLIIDVTSEVPGGPPLAPEYVYAPGPESQNQIAR